MPIHNQSSVVFQFNEFYCGPRPNQSPNSLWSIVTPRMKPQKSKTNEDSIQEELKNYEDWTEEELLDAATWTVDCLEATLNVRGIRESHLRLTIGQLRSLIIKVVSLCPKRFMCKSEPGGADNSVSKGFEISFFLLSFKQYLIVVVASWVEIELKSFGSSVSNLDNLCLFLCEQKNLKIKFPNYKQY